MPNGARAGCLGGGCKRCATCTCLTVLLAAVVFLGIFIATGFTPGDIWVSVFKPKRPFATTGCMENLRKLSRAMSLYLDSADAFPPKDVWMDELFRYAKADDMLVEEAWKLFQCPELGLGSGVYGYAMNVALSEQLRPLEQDAEDWVAAGKTPAIFDSTDMSKNAHGDPDKLLPKPGRHEGKNHIVFADGHVATLAPEP